MRKNTFTFLTNRLSLISYGILFLVAIIVGYVEYQKNTLQENFEQTKKSFYAKVINLEGELANIRNQVESLKIELAGEKSRGTIALEQIGKVTDTVGAINKLSAIDPQLLQKYSKIYFLNENYVPKELSNIKAEYIYIKSSPLQFLSKVMPYLEKLLKAAAADQTPILVRSAYRSFGDQTTLKSTYKFTYGAGANQFSADQGYSEHQLGSAVDFTTEDLGASFSGFENSAAYHWLTNNAYKYGFVLSYPANNSYYQFEPWHWRFVGVDLANKLHRENSYFYDLDQRTIDNYLLVFFD